MNAFLPPEEWWNESAKSFNYLGKEVYRKVVDGRPCAFGLGNLPGWDILQEASVVRFCIQKSKSTMCLIMYASRTRNFQGSDMPSRFFRNQKESIERREVCPGRPYYLLKRHRRNTLIPPTAFAHEKKGKRLMRGNMPGQEYFA